MDDKAKTSSEVTKESTRARVEEHPIAEAEAKKFAGVGDFSLPTQPSPLDNLIGSVAQPAAQPLASKPMAAAVPMPTPRADSTKELERKAKELLKNTETKPIKKKRSRTATTMALAAVLLVMMGAGGIAGMNLLRMQQSADNRSQAACGSDPNDGCTVGSSTCQMSNDGKNTGYNCECIDLSYTGCVRSVWRCTTYDTTACPVDSGDGDPPATSFKCDDGVTEVRVNGNCLESAGGAPVYMARYFCDRKQTTGDGCPGPNDDPATVTSENLEVSSLCATKPNASWCGVVQVDWGRHPSGCSVSRVFKCKDGGGGGTTKPVFSCDSLTSDPSQPISLNTRVRFTCAGTGEGIDHYEFRYKIVARMGDEAEYQPLAASSELGKSEELLIDQKKNYVVQCRACKADGACTSDWGAASR